MKKYFTLKPRSLGYHLLLLLLWAATQQAFTQTYVNHAASGNNDGTSWADAYTELATALDNYSEGDEIWVAAGTYLPQQPSVWTGAPRQMFYIYQDVALYGGFDGTETMLSERDPAANVTILSGDLNGDDVDDDFEANREDNALNVMVIDTLTTAATVIDGFTLEGGHADIDDDYFPNKRGGGIFTWGAIQVRNCIFQQNYTIWHGGGIYFWEEGASSGRVENCLFQHNKCLQSGGGLWASNILGEELVVENCQFDNNEANSGGGANVLNSFASFNNCQFTNNLASYGGGLRLVFTAEGAGSQNITVSACDFQGNSAGISGGAINYGTFNNSTDNSVTISGCQVTENTSARGGGFWYYSEGTFGNITIEACNFIGNEAVITAENSAPDAAGLGFRYATNNPSQNDTIRVVDCLIQDNTTEGVTGGLLYLHSAGADNHLQVDNCEFIGNSEGSGSGVGGMAVAEGGEDISVLVRNTLFDGNSGPISQGFGVGSLFGVTPPEERQIELINCLFTKHDNTDTEPAVVITNRELTLTNCTFADNQSALLGTVADGKITIQNNIFQANGAPSYTPVDAVGNQPIRSLGGNLISDDAMDTWLTSTDQSGTDPLFETGTFQLSQNSPAVDAGVLLDELTATDFSGNARLQGSCIDIGAIESPYDAGIADCLVFTNTRELLDDLSSINIFPNPASGLANIGIENKWIGELELRIVNALGQVVHTATFEKYDEQAVVTFDAGHLPKGLYQVLVSDGQLMAVGSFMRL